MINSEIRPRLLWLWIVAGLVATGLAWAGYTHHAWEDYYITFRASKNLATGQGLTFTPGERVHSFTSPLGVRLPARASVLTGNHSDDAALWVFRCMSLAAYAGAGFLLWRLCRALHGSRWAAWLLLVLYALDTKIVDFSTNGMETGILMLFLAWTLSALLLAPPRQAWQLGLAWAGLMWTRPDSCVYIAVLSLGALLFGSSGAAAGARINMLRTLLTAGVIAAVLYLPWLVWAWSYYGTPVPHTITAKALFHPPVTLGNLPDIIWAFPAMLTAHVDMLATTFMPPYSSITGWPVAMLQSTFWVAALVTLVWALPGVRRETRLASAAFCAGQFYLTVFVGFPVPWYVPTNTVFALLVIAGVTAQLDQATRPDPTLTPPFRALRVGGWILSGLLVAGSLTITVLAAHQLRRQQALIERGERQAIGLWLRDQAATPRDTVLLEPLGYIGFYSNLKMLDFPGLSSPEVIAARRRAHVKAYPDCWAELIVDLRPDWLVLRPYEAAVIRRLNPAIFRQDYDLAKVFDVRPQVQALPFIMGRGYLLNDACFEVYHRRARHE